MWLACSVGLMLLLVASCVVAAPLLATAGLLVNAICSGGAWLLWQNKRRRLRLVKQKRLSRDASIEKSASIPLGNIVLGALQRAAALRAGNFIGQMVPDCHLYVRCRLLEYGCRYKLQGTFLWSPALR